MPVGDETHATIYACGHGAGWYVTSLEDAPRCVVCNAPVRAVVAPRLRLIEGGDEGSGTTSP